MIANFFALKSFTHLVVDNCASLPDRLFINYMFVQLKVKNHASVSQPKVFWKNQMFASLSKSSKLVMVIVTILAIQTVMIIVTLLAIETVIASS